MRARRNRRRQPGAPYARPRGRPCKKKTKKRSQIPRCSIFGIEVYIKAHDAPGKPPQTKQQRMPHAMEAVIASAQRASTRATGRMLDDDEIRATTASIRRHSPTNAPFPTDSTADSAAIRLTCTEPSTCVLFLRSTARPLCYVLLMCSLVPSSPAPCWPAEAAATLAPRHGCRHYRLPGGPHGTAPSAQLLPFPLRPDLHRNARTPRARAGLSRPHARRHGAAASPGGGWGGGGARGRAEGARGQGSS